MGSAVYYTLSDHIGSTSITLSNTGTKVAEMRYKAWGEVRYENGNLQTDRTYTGQRSYTDDFGLMFYNARWYDSYTGRFAQTDNIPLQVRSTQSLDRFAYVSNNPINRIDPTGHREVCIDVWDNQQSKTVKKCHEEPDTTTSSDNDWLEPVKISFIHREMLKMQYMNANIQHWIAAFFGSASGGHTVALSWITQKFGGNGAVWNGNKFPLNSKYDYLYRLEPNGEVGHFAPYNNGNSEIVAKFGNPNVNSTEVLARLDFVGEADAGVDTPHLQSPQWNTNPKTGARFMNDWINTVEFDTAWLEPVEIVPVEIPIELPPEFPDLPIIP